MVDSIPASKSKDKHYKAPPLSTSDFRTVIAACSAITVFGLAFGMTYPLLSLMLEERGISADIIGYNSAMMPLGILLFSPLIPYFSC